MVTCHPEDSDKLKDLMFDADDEFDFSLAVPDPIALYGMLLELNDDKIGFNRGLDTRDSLLTTDDFIKLLREANTAENAAILGFMPGIFSQDIDSITTDKELVSKVKEDLENHNRSSIEILTAERLFIDRLEYELKSAPCYSPEKPVESILEYFLNNPVIDYEPLKGPAFFHQRIYNAKRGCTPAVRYALEALEDMYKTACTKAYGTYDSCSWNNNNWGTKWNACECMVLGDFTQVDFDTAWSPPIEWLCGLAEKVEEQGIRDFSAKLLYAEEGMWFGGRFCISSPSEYFEECFSDDEIKCFLGLEDEEEYEDDDCEDI